jgi:type I restriction enzyme S subunit
MWPSGTLCITIAANIAKGGILEFDACFPDSVVGFLADSDTTVFVRVWLSFLQEHLERMAPESAQKNINLAVLRTLMIPRPPDHMIAEFGTRMRSVRTLQIAGKNHLENSNALFEALQYRAFRGEL